MCVPLTVVLAGGTEVQFKIKMKTRLGKVFDAFCSKEGAEVATNNGRKSYPFRFLSPDGERIDPDATALELGLEDEDK
jgi:hypothetical protein